MAENVSKSIIIGDDILPQTATKLTITCSSEFGALLWRHLTLQSKTAIWVNNYSPSHAKQPQRYFGNVLPYDFWCVQSCLFRAIFGLPMPNINNCCQCYTVTSKFFLYRYISTFYADFWPLSKRNAGICGFVASCR